MSRCWCRFDRQYACGALVASEDELLMQRSEPLRRVTPFTAAFLSCLAAIAVLHLLQYLLFSTPTYYRIGLPSWFWTRDGDYSRFRAVSFVIDLGIALYGSFRFLRWYSRHR